jgi:hypothetical protein
VEIVTIWERRAEGEWRHNHISDGYQWDMQEPVAISVPQARAWAGAEWRATPGHLTDGVLFNPGRCEHGAVRESHRFGPLIAFACPVGTCRCCGTGFPFMEMGCGPVLRDTPEGRRECWEGTEYFPHDLCQECGGVYRPFCEPWGSEPKAPELPLPTLQERLAAYKARKQN